MKLNHYNYPIPKNLIAKHPTKKRDHSRLMVLNRKSKTIEDKVFTDIVDYVQSGDVIVVNKTKVFQARLIGIKEKTNAKIEVFMLRQLSASENIWDVIVEPARKVRIGNKIYFDNGNIWCEIIDNTTSRGRTVRFNYDQGDFYSVLEKIGLTPIPRYMKRDPNVKDKERYQTIFAEDIGAVAAPTAGLHFTPGLVKKLKKKGVHFASVLLHIGIGTFRIVETEDLSKHRMDSEYYSIPPETVDIVNKAILNKKRIIVVGTSSCRALESSVTNDGLLKLSSGWTDKFIFPPYKFKIPNYLITNFHMPYSTLLMLTTAFGGFDFVMQAYKHAIKKKYRFYSYGDSMIII
ncbi:MAG: tRNA preQ1(34) S-adenosylmethionine ribosyltransferase-isomerase QueA [Bacteroidetes bacterium]|nr:tRNA preQ1(34) S-adenosylmethionine ribosyltransferase-isomerase QueA [Bacteroidota bacterium]